MLYVDDLNCLNGTVHTNEKVSERGGTELLNDPLDALIR